MDFGMDLWAWIHGFMDTDSWTLVHGSMDPSAKIHIYWIQNPFVDIVVCCLIFHCVKMHHYNEVVTLFLLNNGYRVVQQWDFVVCSGSWNCHCDITIIECLLHNRALVRVREMKVPLWHHNQTVWLIVTSQRITSTTDSGCMKYYHIGSMDPWWIHGSMDPCFSIYLERDLKSEPRTSVMWSNCQFNRCLNKWSWI